jgi:NAD-specific glutamate dehydrogenase
MESDGAPFLHYRLNIDEQPDWFDFAVDQARDDLVKEYDNKIIELEKDVAAGKDQIYAWNQLGQTLVTEIRESLEQLEITKSALAFAAGIISTLPEYKDKHPEEVQDMLLSYGAASYIGVSEDE